MSRVDVDAVVVGGGGFSGLYMLKRLRDLGMSTRGFEAAPEVGGTWWWNRYPGARSDSDSHVYLFSPDFDSELAYEWEWSERYPSQPEILSYLQRLADKHDLRKDITFSTKVTSAHYDEPAKTWTVTTDGGETLTSRFVILAVGALSTPNVPDFPGLESFGGQWYHSARLPEEGLEYAGKRVGVIGNGATAVQIVPVVAEEAAHVYEFSRSPYHCLPGRNHKLDKDDWEEIRAHFPEIWERARNHVMGLPYADSAGMSTDYTDEEAEKICEAAWQQGGFPALVSTFDDLPFNAEANARYLDFMARKIRARVTDPEVAERLIPREPVVSKRPPIEHGYYTAFNRDNVTLVDIKAAPITEITESGVRTADGQEYEVDILLLATGFDAYTGSLMKIDVRGRGGMTLADKWADGLKTYLGLAMNGFPNMFMLYCGPLNPAILTNAVTLIEQQGKWIIERLAHMQENGLESMEATEEAEAQFVEFHKAVADMTLIPQTASWWTGTNVEGKPRGLLSFVGGFPQYQLLCQEAASNPDSFAVEGGRS
jgi:cyclohexanone monooxygenase